MSACQHRDHHIIVLVQCEHKSRIPIRMPILWTTLHDCGRWPRQLAPPQALRPPWSAWGSAPRWRRALGLRSPSAPVLSPSRARSRCVERSTTANDAVDRPSRGHVCDPLEARVRQVDGADTVAVMCRWRRPTRRLLTEPPTPPPRRSLRLARRRRPQRQRCAAGLRTSEILCKYCRQPVLASCEINCYTSSVLRRPRRVPRRRQTPLSRPPRIPRWVATGALRYMVGCMRHQRDG